MDYKLLISPQLLDEKVVIFRAGCNIGAQSSVIEAEGNSTELFWSLVMKFSCILVAPWQRAKIACVMSRAKTDETDKGRTNSSQLGVKKSLSTKMRLLEGLWLVCRYRIDLVGKGSFRMQDFVLSKLTFLHSKQNPSVQ